MSYFSLKEIKAKWAGDFPGKSIRFVRENWPGQAKVLRVLTPGAGVELEAWQLIDGVAKVNGGRGWILMGGES